MIPLTIYFFIILSRFAMSSFTSTSTSSVMEAKTNAYDSYVIQASSAQDFATTGTYVPSTSETGENYEKEPFDFTVVADSHGTYILDEWYYVELFSLIDWSNLLSSPDWKKKIIEKTCKNDTYGTGTTLTIWKIYQDRFECSFVGDSTGKLYSGNEVIFQTKDHDYDNIEDLERVQSIGGLVRGAWDIHLVDGEDGPLLRSKKAKTITINSEKINMSRALGHTGLYYGRERRPEDAFETHVIRREPDKKYKIVSGSDGFWQFMLDSDIDTISSIENNSEFLAKLSCERWNQKWDWDNTLGTIEKCVSLPKSNIDDIAVTCWYC